MDTLENKKYASSADTTVEKTLYILSNIILVLGVISSLILLVLWFIDEYGRPAQIFDILGVLFTTLFFWCFSMGFLKIINLLRHIYNRLDDSVLDARNETSEEADEE